MLLVPPNENVVMKAFHCRLDPALRWRTTQLRLEEENVSRTSAQLAAIQRELMATHTALRSGSTQLAAAGAVAFHSWNAYLERCRRRIRALEAQSQELRRELAVRTKTMVEAHQKVRVLENLKRDEKTLWSQALARETEAFAAEAFLARLQRDANSAQRKASQPAASGPRATIGILTDQQQTGA
jgi:chromosome segregation ATPase